MSAERLQHAQARQLQRLRTQRAERARREQAQAHEAQRRALAALRDAEAEHDARRQALRTLLAARGAGAVTPQLLPYAEARRAALDEAVERAEYALLDEQEALDTADRLLDRARTAWRQAQLRQQAADEACRRTQADCRRAAAARAEREDTAAAARHPDNQPGARP